MTTRERFIWFCVAIFAAALLTHLAMSPDPLAEPDRASTVRAGR